LDKKISVIVPIYAVEQYLHRCVDSIMNQTYPHLQIVLVDDGSPDRCGDICDAYARAESKVRVIHQPNRGLSAARNAGLEIATGDYISFVDGDDWLDNSCLEHLLQLITHHEADISVSNLFRTSDDKAEPKFDEARVYVLSREEAIFHLISPRVGSMVAACGKLYNSDLFEFIRFPDGRLHEDAFTTYKVILNTKKVVVTTAALYGYRQRPDSITGSPFKLTAKLDIIDALVERAQVLRSEGMNVAASATSGQVLATFMQIAEYAAARRADPEAVDFDSRATSLKLLRPQQPAKFRAFYLLHMISPRITSLIYERLRH